MTRSPTLRTARRTLAAAIVGAMAAIAAHHAAAASAEYRQRFLTQYDKIKNPTNGYFSADGVPYHAVETLIVEAPDHGHQTTSEAYSFWLWLEAQYGRATGDWGPLNRAWANMEKHIIPATADQPTNGFYNAGKPASYASEFPLPTQYPAQIQPWTPVGQDPIANELASAYGTRDIYGMHWLLDVDNWYGYGRCGDGLTKPAYINTFQRGPQESVWETVPHPSCETFRWGRQGGQQGFLSLFTGDANYAKQWRYTNAPDADARAVQAIYWAAQWARAQGKSAEVAGLVAKAARMGDYLRYAMFDKYFKKIGMCVGAETCPGGSGQADAQGWRDNQHYLMSWYYAWGGANDQNAGWAWRIGSSHNHSGYQNPMAAWVLSSQAEFRPASPSGAGDWAKSLTRQLEFYRWLQSAEGAIAGGATNSWNGNYGAPPAGTATFHGMFYDEKPVYHDPASNTWFGFQAWTMHRVAEYYHASGDARAKAVLDKWIEWAIAGTRLNADGTYAVPNTLAWSGQPDTWNAAAPGANANLHVRIVDRTADVGVAAALARALTWYGAKAGHVGAKKLAGQLLDRMWAKHQDAKGVAIAEQRADYLRFDDRFDPATGSGVYIPAGWTGTNAQGATIDSNATFIGLRPKYRQDPHWPKLEAYLNGGAAPTWTYHRFWAQADVAMAMADYAHLVGDDLPSITVGRAAVAVPEGGAVAVDVSLSKRPAATVAVGVSKATGGDADLSAAPAALTFTAANWNVPQRLTIAAARDTDAVNGSARFELRAAGHAAAAVAATEIDADVVAPIALVVGGAPLRVPEGRSAAFTVRLAAAPKANVHVAVARSSGDADLSVAGGASLVFTPTSWNVDQRVTIAAAEDADAVDGSANFAFSNSAGPGRSVAAIEADNDAAAADCEVTVDTSNDWGNGQVTRVTLRNLSAAAIDGWSMRWTASNDFTLGNYWNATVTAGGRVVTAGPAAWNASVPAGGSVEFGLQIGYAGARPVPTGVSWAGRNCAIVVR